MVRHSTIATLRNIYIYHDEFALIMLKIDSDQEIPILEVNVTVRDFIIGICGLLFALSIISIIFSSFTTNSAQSVAIKNNVNNSNNNISSFGMPGHPGGSCTQTTYWDTMQFSQKVYDSSSFFTLPVCVEEDLSFIISQVEKNYKSPSGNTYVSISSPEVSKMISAKAVGAPPCSGNALGAQVCNGIFQCIPNTIHSPNGMQGTVYGVQYSWSPSFSIPQEAGFTHMITNFALTYIIQNNGKEIQIWEYIVVNNHLLINWQSIRNSVESLTTTVATS